LGRVKGRYSSWDPVDALAMRPLAVDLRTTSRNGSIAADLSRKVIRQSGARHWGMESSSEGTPGLIPAPINPLLTRSCDVYHSHGGHRER